MPNARKAAVKKAPPKRKLAEEFCPGEVFTDLAKKSWKLGPVIGKGGFGCLYLGKIAFKIHIDLFKGFLYYFYKHPEQCTTKNASK